MRRSQARRRTDPFPFLLAILIVGVGAGFVFIMTLDIMSRQQTHYIEPENVTDGSLYFPMGEAFSWVDNRENIRKIERFNPGTNELIIELRHQSQATNIQPRWDFDNPKYQFVYRECQEAKLRNRIIPPGTSAPITSGCIVLRYQATP